MKMRWLAWLLAGVLAIPAGAWAQAAKPRSATGGTKPVIEIPITDHDFGEVYKESKFLHAFTVYNRGNADLVIEEVKPG